MVKLALRPLTEQEERLLCWILEHGSNEAKSYSPQVEGMRARSSCSCGCPSIELISSDNAPIGIATKDRILADLLGQSPEGIPVGILLFQDQGRLSELEFYPFDEAGKFGLPAIESLSPFQPGEQNSLDS